MKEDPTFTAKDAKNLAGLSYRQLNDWESRNALPGERVDGRSWRRFTPKQIFAVMVCAEIRRLYGIPVEKLKFVQDYMMVDDERNHFEAVVELMSVGLHVYLLTDLENDFVIDSDLEFTDLMKYGYFHAENTRPYIFLRLNEIVNRLLSAHKEPIQLNPTDQIYRLRAEIEAAQTACTTAERELLQALRSGNYDRIVVELHDGAVKRIDAEGDADPTEIDDEDDGVRLKKNADFETFEVHRRDGRVVRVRRKLPRKYSKKDNKRYLFEGLVKSNPSDGVET